MVRRRAAAAAVLAAGIAMPASRPLAAQQRPLYDPQPPANAAYVRVLAAAGPVDVQVGTRTRARAVPAATPSPYLVLAPGAHTLNVRAGARRIDVPVTSVATRSFTVVVPATGAAVVTEDRVNGNRLKAALYAYHLGTGGAVDIWSADFRTPVFRALAPGGHAALIVNPVALDVVVTAAGSRTVVATGRFELTAGGAASLVVTGDEARRTLGVHGNTIERLSPD